MAQRSPSYTSTVTGLAVGWRVKGAAGMLSLRLLDGNTGVLGAAVANAETGKVLPAAIPVTAGQRFGIAFAQAAGTKVGWAVQPGASFSAWSPALGPGEKRAPNENATDAELAFNVLVQPAPGISAVTPASAPLGSSDPVTISGHDFIAVEDVSFGGFSAQFEVSSESTIVAKPFGVVASAVPVTVTTRAGTVSLPAAFTFEDAAASGQPSGDGAPPSTPDIPPLVTPPLDFPVTVECRVPKLRGKALAQAKPALAAAHCKLGAVSRRRGTKAKHPKVLSLLPPAGSHAPADTRVRVRLG